MQRIGVVLFNLGGPDSLDAVYPFLRNLFSDPAIINVPNPVRWGLARLIARRRLPTARKIYEELGGGSPLMEMTREQAEALESALHDRGVEAQVTVAMRYWHPFAAEAARALKAFAPDKVVALPLYPQYSETTTGSSFKVWDQEMIKNQIEAETTKICCYPTESGFIKAVEEKTREALDRIGGNARVLFSAHGLPEKVIERGDPYQAQTTLTASAVAAAMGLEDWTICYQSRVGPMRWIGPGTDEEIQRAGKENRSIVIVPIAFVSEHSETLIELDQEYRELAKVSRVPAYERASTVQSTEAFIEGLADMVERATGSENRICVGGDDIKCDTNHTKCLYKTKVKK